MTPNALKVAEKPLSDQAKRSFFRDGEAVVVLRRDGTAEFMTVGINSDAIMTKIQKGEELSAEECDDLEVAGKAFALAFAANTPMVMEILEDLANNPDIIDAEKLSKLGRRN